MRIHTIASPTYPEPFRIAWLDLPGTYRNRTPRVFLHGLGSSSIATFPEHAVQGAQDAPRAILIDLPGFGYSRNAPEAWSFSIEDQADLVAAMLQHLGIGPATVIGHSMGGSIAIALASRHPQAAASLIVAEPNLDPGVGTLSSHIANQPEATFMARGYDRLVHATANQAARGETGSAIYLPALQQALPVAMHRAAVSLLADRTPTFREQLTALASRIPATFIFGDRTPDLTGLDALAAASVTLAEIPNAGHVMMDDNPAAFVAALLAAEDRTSR
ncbi:MAG: alpha/beta fold hydrolase [Thermomicrobiales bacterium]